MYDSLTELEHYGVLGMKWGVRRTPKQLGHSPSSGKKKNKKKAAIAVSATLAGAALAGYGLYKYSSIKKTRSSKIGSKAVQKLGDRIINVKTKDAIKSARRNALRNRRILTDEELKSAINRLNLEKQFKQLASDDLHQGKAMIADILKSAGPQAAKIMTSGAILYSGKVAMTKQFNWKEAADYITPKPKKK